MRLLITGSSGYVGNFLAEHFAGLGHEVVACDIRPLERQSGVPGIVFRQLDVTDAVAVRRAVAETQPDRVLHLAYLMSPQHDAALEEAVDVRGSRNVLAAAEAVGSVRQLVLFSSTSAYGAHPDNPEFLEESAPLRPADYAYGRHKKTVEEIYLTTPRRPNLGLVILRMCTAVGPSYYKPGGLVAAFAKSPVMPLVGGDARVQWIHEFDVKALVWCVVVTPAKSGIFNLAPDDWTSASAMAQALGKPTLRLPYWLVRGGVAAAWYLRLGTTSPPMVRLMRYGIVATPRKISDFFGYRFRYGSLAAFLDAVERRRAAGLL